MIGSIIMAKTEEDNPNHLQMIAACLRYTILVTRINISCRVRARLIKVVTTTSLVRIKSKNREKVKNIRPMIDRLDTNHLMAEVAGREKTKTRAVMMMAMSSMETTMLKLRTTTLK